MSQRDEFNPFKAIFTGVAVLIIILLIWSYMTAVVPAGYVGVKDTFGNVDNDVLQSGFHLKSPLTGVHMMSVRTQKYMDYGSSDKATITALSNDGLATTMDVAVMYHLDPVKAVEIYRGVGENYADVVMVNPIHSVPRDLISRYDTKTLYSASTQGSTDRAKIEGELMEGITARLNDVGVKNSIIIEQVSIRNIDFPQVYKDAITNKMKMDTEIQQKELEVKKQDMESNRMRSEAQGIADANRIISGSLTESYLKWYTIEMMKQHTGATYFMPTGSDGVVIPQLVKTIDNNPPAK
jgi:regulator of protease activity HflC (stomatin/prohibitin superfamily)